MKQVVQIFALIMDEKAKSMFDDVLELKKINHVEMKLLIGLNKIFFLI